MVLPKRKHRQENSNSCPNFTRFPPLSLCRVPHLSRCSGMAESSTQSSMSCPRCQAGMDEIVRIEPTVRDQGLIAYECPKCVYVTSVLLKPQPRESPG